MTNLTIKGILKPINAWCYEPVLSIYNIQTSNEMFIHFPELDGTNFTSLEREKG